jgi:hypothetical protein
MADKKPASESKAHQGKLKKQVPGPSPDRGAGTAGLAAMPNGTILKFAAGSVPGGGDELANDRWQGAQRRSFANALGKLGGNRTMQRTLNDGKPTKKSGVRSPSRTVTDKHHGGGEPSTTAKVGAESLEAGVPGPSGPVAGSPPADPGSNGKRGSGSWRSTPLTGSEQKLARTGSKAPGKVLQAAHKGTARIRPAKSVLPQLDRTGAIVQRQGGGAGGSPQPIPVLPDADRRQSLALDILKKAYGGRIKKETKVNGMANESVLRAMYDLAMIGMGRVFVESDGTKRPWMPGDSLKHPDMSTELSGFFDPKSGQVFIDLSKKPDAQVATMVHELLHASSSPEFGETLGKDLDEGMTEKLTQDAFTKSGYDPPTGFFEGQIATVGQIGSLVGENTMKNAYFNGTGGLRSMMETRLGEGVFDRFALEVRQRNWNWLKTFFDRYATAVNGTEAEKKIAAINSLLDGWVSDTDLDNIENIWNASSSDEKAEIAKAVRPRVGSLIDLGQRTRLRTILAS